MEVIKGYKEFYFETAKQLFAIDSVSGFCNEAIEFVEGYAERFGFSSYRFNKGNCVIEIPGHDDSKTIGLSAHIDTLGAMVRSIGSDGTLKFVRVGGPILPTLDGEYCTLRARNGQRFTGTFLSDFPSAHVHSEASSAQRDEKSMYVRLDEEVKNKEDVEKLGISAGDFIFIDPKTVVTPSGFLKSRFIDDKASVVCLIAMMKYWHENKMKPAYNLKLIISSFEEVGHGASYIPSDITELLALDMGCIGEDLSCTEYDVSICAKDSSGPYDYDMVTKLVELAKTNDLSFAVDIYPQYGSDVSAALRAGHDIRGALIGTGVHASHGMERTHWKGIYNTICLALHYVDKP